MEYGREEGDIKGDLSSRYILSSSHHSLSTFLPLTQDSKSEAIVQVLLTCYMCAVMYTLLQAEEWLP